MLQSGFNEGVHLVTRGNVALAHFEPFSHALHGPVVVLFRVLRRIFCEVHILYNETER